MREFLFGLEYKQGVGHYNPFENKDRVRKVKANDVREAVKKVAKKDKVEVIEFYSFEEEGHHRVVFLKTTGFLIKRKQTIIYTIRKKDVDWQVS